MDWIHYFGYANFFRTWAKWKGSPAAELYFTLFTLNQSFAGAPRCKQRGMFAPPLEIPLKETITLNNLVWAEVDNRKMELINHITRTFYLRYCCRYCYWVFFLAFQVPVFLATARSAERMVFLEKLEKICPSFNELIPKLRICFSNFISRYIDRAPDLENYYRNW
jgi:hypothetical protein